MIRAVDMLIQLRDALKADGWRRGIACRVWEARVDDSDVSTQVFQCVALMNQVFTEFDTPYDGPELERGLEECIRRAALLPDPPNVLPPS